jgi:DNA-binding beta-propeller fold protein YncE
MCLAIGGIAAAALTGCSQHAAARSTPAAPRASAATTAPASATGQAGVKAYALTHSALVPLNIGTRTAGNPIATDAQFDQMALSPDGRTAYIATFNHAAAQDVDAIDLTTGTERRLDALPDTDTAPSIAVSPDGGTLYVAYGDDGGSSLGGTLAYGKVWLVPIATASGQAQPPIPIAANLTGDTMVTGLALSPDGRTAFVAWSSGAVQTGVTRVDLTARATRGRLASGAGNDVSGLQVTTDGTALYGEMEETSTGEGLAAFTTASGAPGPEVDIVPRTDTGDELGHFALAPDGRTAYAIVNPVLTAADNGATSVRVYPIDLTTHRLGTPISLGYGMGEAIRVSADGSTIYVDYAKYAPDDQSIVGEWLDAITPSTGAVTQTAPIPAGPDVDLALAPA